MDAQIAEFTSITGADAGQASFYLSACGNNLEAAIEMYFGSGAAAEAQTGSPATVPAAPAPGGPRTLSGAPAPAFTGHPTSAPSAPAKKATTAKPARFRTLSDMGRGDDDSDDEEKGTRTYAGGTSSGLAVQNDAREIARQVMENARAAGAKDAHQAMDEDRQAFSGAGYRLGANPVAPTKPIKGTVKNEVPVTIHMWNNGFSVDDGPLRKFDEPENRQFMDELNQGRVPRELHGRAKQDPELGPPEFTVHLMQENKDYVEPPKPAFQAFTGSGRSMSGAPAAGGGGAHAPPAAAPAPVVPVEFAVDPAKEVTTLRIILADGTRLQAKFNVDHTIGDIRRFIDRSRPGQTRGYDLITTMPREVFGDNSKTIIAAGLKNATVVQHPH